MPFREEERDFLITNAARDRAEVLLAQLRELAASAARGADLRQDLTEEQMVNGRNAMDEAIAATEQMVASLNEAMSVVEQAVHAGGWGALDAQDSPGDDDSCDDVDDD